MYNYFLDHAVKNVWCNPRQDNSYIFKPARISKPAGELNQMPFMNRHLHMPVSDKRMHVYQIGQIKPDFLGLESDKLTWINEHWESFSDVVNNCEVNVDIYSDNGLQLPKYKSWFMFSKENNLIIATEQIANIDHNYNLDIVYLRFYSNSFFESIRSDNLVTTIFTQGRTIETTNDVLFLQNQESTYRQMIGDVNSFVNGLRVNAINLLTVKIGDSVEYVYDSSFKTIANFQAASLQSFRSILDSSFKYLLCTDSIETQIDYHDDIDIYVTRLFGTSSIGVYYNHNLPNHYRMITNKDYSIDAYYIDRIFKYLKDITGDADNSKFNIELRVRNSGYKRNLVFDNSRIFELYKLPYVERIQCLLGINSGLNIWSAENLENNKYAELMRIDYKDITLDLITKSYGYNSMSKIVGDFPIITNLKNNRQVAILPYLLTENSTIYEYDNDGVLLGSHYHISGSEYYADNNDAKFIEAIYGKGSDTPNMLFGKNDLNINPNADYRVYVDIFINGIASNKWIDITNSDKYSIVSNKLIWLGSETEYLLMIRTNESFLHLELSMRTIAGNLTFTLYEYENRGNGVNPHQLSVPMGDLDIWLNGKSLIMGLDYALNFPKIIITNKRFLNQPSGSLLQKITVRYTGFCDQDCNINSMLDYGFIEHGMLSNNNKYDLRDDKVLRITVGGRLVNRNDILFSEDHNGVFLQSGLNGSPYQIKDVVVPLHKLTGVDTNYLKNLSIEIDKQVSSFMTLHSKQPLRPDVSAISNKYELLSPFFTHIVNDLWSDQINNENLDNIITDMDVINMCSQYEFLLKYDPITYRDNINWDYVILHPHNLISVINLTLSKYKFLTRVVKLYGHNLINLSTFVNLNNNTGV